MSIKDVLFYVKKMGLKYTGFRVWYEIQRRSGLLRYFYPVHYKNREFISLQKWRIQAKPFFITTNSLFNYDEPMKKQLEKETARIISGEIQFFKGKWYPLGREYDWLTNPESGYHYSRTEHWTKVNDFSSTQGDIKYVWEKARFSYICTILRNDLANNTDNSRFVWAEMLSWIAHSPNNCGPHHKCSQEISIRVLNWIFALYFYKDSETLSEEEFKTIINALYVQTKHVDSNILFSKIAVRNNHAITESLCLFTVGLLFPWFPESTRWVTKGKRYLEEEGLYQIYDDGSYIQHSFNYQRVAFQLYTWAFAVANVNSIRFSLELEERLKKSIDFLKSFIDVENGCAPNWGANDSALFFPLNNQDLNDFRPQINALCRILGKTIPYTSQHTLLEDSYWFSGEKIETSSCEEDRQASCLYRSFGTGGYYVIKTAHACTYIRCAEYVHRPFHADNLHIDIWFNHDNIIRDAGTYKYNGDSEYVNFFTGTSGHNTIMIDDYDQMQKGKRFIWYGWTKALKAVIKEEKEYISFEGAIAAFRHIGESVIHTRKVNVYRESPLWMVHDFIEGCSGKTYSQIWNIKNNFFDSGFEIIAQADGKVIYPVIKEVWFSDCYGMLQDARQIVFTSRNPDIRTVIYHSSLEKSEVLKLL